VDGRKWQQTLTRRRETVERQTLRFNRGGGVVDMKLTRMANFFIKSWATQPTHPVRQLPSKRNSQKIKTFPSNV
jgi:hypothetical protein